MQARLWVVWLFVFIAGCTSQPLQSGREFVLQQAHERITNNETLTEANCATGPGNLAGAMQLALQCNPNIQVALAGLDISTADLNQQIRINNPNLELGLRDSDQASGLNIELDLIAPVLDLILYPSRKSAARVTLSRHQQRALANILSLTSAVESAWRQWVASDYRARIAKQYALTWQLNAELGERYFDAGNINLHELSSLQIDAGKGALLEQQLVMQSTGAKIELQRLLGAQHLPKLHDNLHILPFKDPEIAYIWQLTLDHHPLLQAANLQNNALSKGLALERRYRFLLDFGAGISLEQEPGNETLIGPAIELELPIFNQNQAEIAAATGKLNKSQQQQRALINHFYAEIRLAIGQMQLARQQLNQYREQILPAYRSKMDQTQKNYNYMLSGAFELLQTRAEQFEAQLDFLDQINHYWQAAARLSRLSGGMWHPPQTPVLQLSGLISHYDEAAQEHTHANTP